MHIKNENLPNQELNVKGKLYTSDEYGVFEMSDADGAALVKTPGFSPCRMTAEVLAAEKALKEAENKMKRATVAFKAAKDAASHARNEANEGRGTPVTEAPQKPAAVEEDAEDEEEAKVPPKPAAAPESDEAEDEEEEDADEDEEDEDEERPELPEDIAAGQEPNMKWTSDRLIRYAKAIGIEGVDTGWSKAQILNEIESRTE